MQAGQSREGLNFQQVRQLTIARPPLAEQRAVADMLDGVDKSVAQARAGTSVLKSVKGAMADALLTGRVRVRGSKGMRKE